MFKKISILFLLAIFLITSGFGCKITDKETQEAMKPVTLRFWRVFDGQDAFDQIIANYRTLHPFINIEYRKLRYEEYEAELLNALAEDRGPDIFSIHNTWIKKYQSKLVPMPATITMAYPVTRGTIKKETIPELRTTASLSLKDIRDKFIDTVSYDVISDDQKVYGLPLFVDTLVLLYNRDLFNNAGLSEIPQYWNSEFLQNVKKMTKQNQKGEIIQSGIALGGTTNISRFSDILSLIMMQNGATLLSNKSILFNQNLPGSNYNPGVEALRFYTDFANPLKESYTWNSSLPNSLEMFISGQVAMIFAYSYDLPTIKTRAPKLNFSIARVPQIEGTPPTNVNFANYWVEVVSKKSKNVNEAWDFIQFITREDQAKIYLEKTGRPTALKSLIVTQKNNDEIKVFADQLLTAKSWYRGYSPQAAESAFKEMIDTVNSSSGQKLEDIINRAADKLQQTVY